MKRTIKITVGIVIIIVLAIICFWCFLEKWAPQGHGSESNYSFKISKVELENKIDSLVNFDPNITRKELASYPDDNYYNKDEYFTIIVDDINYCFRYYGDSIEWTNSKNSSEIFIASITDGKLKKSDDEYIEVIEKKFIQKLGSYIKR